MKTLIQITLLTFVFFSTLIQAHPNGHDKPQAIHKEEAITIANSQVKQLIEKGDIDKSWEAVKASSTTLERVESRMNWIITFKNPHEVDEGKKVLSVYLTNAGYFISTKFKKK